MARNLSREFATMSDDERRRFALEQGGTTSGPEGERAADELDFDDPRDPDHMGKQYASLEDEVADPDARDGGAALLDDEAHRQHLEDDRGRQDG